MPEDVMKTELKRCLNVFDLVFMGLSHMLGNAIFVLTGVMMANVAGASVILSYLFAGFASILNGLCYAQFSVNIPKAGTAYNYVYIVTGELLGFLAGWNILLEYLISVAAVSRGLSMYIDSLTGGVIRNATLSAFGPIHSTFFAEPDFLAGALVLVVFTLVAIGIRTTVTLLNILTVLDIIVVLIIAITGFSVGSPDNFNDEHGGFFLYGIEGTLAATGTMFFAYIGFDAIAVAAEETANPSRSLPIAMVLTILIACILYCCASLSLALMTPYDQINIKIPFPDALKSYNLKWASGAVAIGSFFGMIASIIGQGYCLPRGLYAMASDGLVFHQFKYVNSWTKTPLISILISAIFATILTIVIRYDELVEMVAIGTLFAMSVMLIALLKLHYLPAQLCPFELSQTDSSAEELQKDSNDKAEKTPILPKRPKEIQPLEQIGHLRFKLPFTLDRDDNYINTVVLTILVFSVIFLSVIVSTAWPFLQQAQWWAILLLVIAASSTLLSFTALLMFEHNKRFARFSVSLSYFMFYSFL